MTGSRKPEAGKAVFFSLFLASGFWLLAPGAASAAHCLALYGECKYKADFRHFEYVNPAAPKGGAIKLAETGTFDSLNYFALKGVKAPGLREYLSESLMTPSLDEPQSLYGLIAESVTVADDRLSAEFVIRREARWSDGSAITPDDVAFSFTALKEKGDPVYRIMFAGIAGCEKTGERTVRFTFTDPDNRELPLIAASMPIVSKAYYTANDFEQASLIPPLSSGPYKIESVDPGRSIVYARDPNYWGKDLPVNRGQYNFGAIRFDMYRDENVTLEAFKAGAYDFRREYIARNWATGYNAPAVADGRIVKRDIPDRTPQGMQAFIYNTRHAKFADRRVREAIGLSLDYEWVNKTIFYGAYVRNRSFFENTDFEAKGLPSESELKLLEPFACSFTSPLAGEVGAKRRVGGNSATNTPPPNLPPQGGEEYCLPPALFTQEFRNPTTDGSGNARENLLKAQALLDAAGLIIKDGRRLDAAGNPFAIEFLLRQPTMERVIAPMRKNLERLGISSSIRYVDDSQYQKRVESGDFDIVSLWINRSVFYPGNEQASLWHSSQAGVKGSNNLGGVKNPAVDALIAALLSAKTLDELIAVGRALDRVLLFEHYVIPHWHSGSFRVAYWDKFGLPDPLPKYSLGFSGWWVKEGDRH